MGCDSLFVKRIELQKPIDSLQIKIYEHNKTKIVSTIDGIATNNNMFCNTTLDIIRYCNQPPQTLVVFEDKSGFFVCLFMFGMDWEKNKFLHLAKTLEEAIIKSLPNTNLSISRPDELPECSVPPHTFENSRSQNH